MGSTKRFHPKAWFASYYVTFTFSYFLCRVWYENFALMEAPEEKSGSHEIKEKSSFFWWISITNVMWCLLIVADLRYLAFMSSNTNLTLTRATNLVVHSYVPQSQLLTLPSQAVTSSQVSASTHRTKWSRRHGGECLWSPTYLGMETTQQEQVEKATDDFRTFITLKPTFI